MSVRRLLSELERAQKPALSLWASSACLGTMSLPFVRPSGPLLYLRQVEESFRLQANGEERQKGGVQRGLLGGQHLTRHCHQPVGASQCHLKVGKARAVTQPEGWGNRLPERKRDEPLVAQLVNGRNRTRTRLSRPQTRSSWGGQAHTDRDGSPLGKIKHGPLQQKGALDILQGGNQNAAVERTQIVEFEVLMW